MNTANQLLDRIESARMWAYFHKDWLLQIRTLIREQLPQEFSIFVESEAVLISPSSGGAIPIGPDLAITRPDDIVSPAAVASSVATAAVLEVEETYELVQQYSLLIRRSPDCKASCNRCLIGGAYPLFAVIATPHFPNRN